MAGEWLVAMKNWRSRHPLKNHRKVIWWLMRLLIVSTAPKYYQYKWLILLMDEIHHQRYMKPWWNTGGFGPSSNWCRTFVHQYDDNWGHPTTERPPSGTTSFTQQQQQQLITDSQRPHPQSRCMQPAQRWWSTGGSTCLAATFDGQWLSWMLQSSNWWMLLSTASNGLLMATGSKWSTNVVDKNN